MISLVLYVGIGVIAAAAAVAVAVTLQRIRLLPKKKTRTGKRHIHTRNVQRIGGIVILLVVAPGVVVLLPESNTIIGLLIAGAIIVGAGVVDDIREQPAWKQLIAQGLAIAVVVGSGIGLSYIANPFGEILRLDAVQIPIMTLGGASFVFEPFADIFTAVWLLVLMNTFNWIDGVDGLAPSIGVIAAIAIAAISLLPHVQQPHTAILAVVVAGALAGIFILNKFPASLFLGTSGSMLTGLLLGVLAIMSGSKVATALLVLGVPLLDAVVVVLRRWKAGVPVWKADQRHIHHELLKAGLSQGQVVGVLVTISIGFGIIAIAAQSQAKALSLALLAVVITILTILVKRKQQHKT